MSGPVQVAEGDYVLVESATWHGVVVVGQVERISASSCWLLPVRADVREDDDDQAKRRSRTAIIGVIGQDRDKAIIVKNALVAAASARRKAITEASEAANRAYNQVWKAAIK